MVSTGAPPRELALGRLLVAPPVVLAPMAGITNAAFRRLCREQGAGLYVCEMITSPRGRRAATARRCRCSPSTRWSGSARCSSTASTRATSARPSGSCAPEHGVDHVDLNFGCPVPKVTRKGGGAALPWKRDLLRDDPARRPCDAARPYDVPVTIKTRMGIDDDAPHLPRRRPDRRGRRVRGDRPARTDRRPALLRHGRLVGRSPSSKQARRHPGAGQRRHLGGRRRAADGRARPAATASSSAAAASAGRGCSRDLAAAFAGAPGPAPRRRSVRSPPCVRRHAELLAELMGEAARADRPAQAHGLVPQGVRGRCGHPVGARAGLVPGGARRPAGPARPDAAVPGLRARAAARSAGQPAPGGAARRAGSTTGRRTRWERTPSPTSAAAEPLVRWVVGLSRVSRPAPRAAPTPAP